MLRVIKGGWKDKKSIYHRVFLGNEGIKAVVAGVKYVGKCTNVGYDREELVGLFYDVNRILCVAHELGVKKLVELFPPCKVYDGEKWQVKDYYSSMEAVRSALNGWKDSESVLSFWMDYDNADIRKFCVAVMICLTHLQRAYGQEDFMSEFLRENGVPMYYSQTVEGKKLLFDANGEFVSVLRKEYPSYLQVVK